MDANEINRLIELNFQSRDDLFYYTGWQFGEQAKFRQESRIQCIKTLMHLGSFEPALLLLADLIKVDPSVIKDVAIPYLEKELGLLRLPSHLSIQGNDPTGQKVLTATVCFNMCSMPGSFHQPGKIILGNVLKTDNNLSGFEPYQIFVFERLASEVKHLPQEGKKKFLQLLLDLPGVDRGELFQNPKARLLLMKFPNLRKEVFEPIEGRAYEVFCDRKEKLERTGIVFSGEKLNLEKPFEVIAGTIDDSTVDTLLDFAEAAVICAGRIQYATGVLRFLSERVLSDDQIERAVKLRDRIQMAVRFDPDPQVAATFDTVKKLTDDAIKELVG